MKCPVCEMDCITPVKNLLAALPTIFFPVQTAACGTLTNVPRCRL